MKTKKAHPYYYKFMRSSKTLHLISIMILMGVKSNNDNKLKELLDEIETAIIRNPIAEGFYKQKDLLKD